MIAPPRGRHVPRPDPPLAALFQETLGRPLRVLWCSDAPDTSSGYAQVTRQQVPLLAELGVEMALLATYGHHGAIREWRPPFWTDGAIPLFPGGDDPFANDMIPKAAAVFQPDLVITLKDTPVFRAETFAGLRWCGMTPLDHEPIPQPILDRLRAMERPIAYAPNGLRAMRDAGFDPLFVPHSYDPRIVYPMDQAEARAQLGLPQDRFIVGTVAVNRGGIPSRKTWPQNLAALGMAAARHPDLLFLAHTCTAADGYEGGYPLEYLVARYGVPTGFCDQQRYRMPGGYPDEYLTLFYNAIDVLLAVSAGEGFGLPQLEAQATGTPVITSGWCASEDLCFGGWTVAREEALRFPDMQLADVYLPFPAAIADRIEQAYAAHTNESQWGALRAAALAGAEPYALPRVMADHWRPAIEELTRAIANDGSRGVLRIIRPEEVLG